MIKIQKYREFSNIEKDLPIFYKELLFDCVNRESNWSVVLLGKADNINASLPRYKTTNLFSFN